MDDAVFARISRSGRIRTLAFRAATLIPHVLLICGYVFAAERIHDCDAAIPSQAPAETHTSTQLIKINANWARSQENN
jgi:hypothetical protein